MVVSNQTFIFTTNVSVFFHEWFSFIQSTLFFNNHYHFLNVSNLVDIYANLTNLVSALKVKFDIQLILPYQ
jgi:hypothetical protein